MADKINLMIAGFQKAGTTSIKNYLSQHSKILGHPQKEMTFFSLTNEYERGFDRAHARYYKKANFTEFEYVLAKHATLIQKRENIIRLRDYNPDCKLILCLRDPVARAFSSFLMEKTNSYTRIGSFYDNVTEAIERFSHNLHSWKFGLFVQLGIYVDFIEELMQFFKREQIFILFLEPIKERPKQEIESLLSWLGLEYESSIDISKPHNAYQAPRAESVGKLISLLMAEGNGLKEVIRRIVPSHLQSEFGESIRSINRVDKVPPQMDERAKEILTKFYAPYNMRLKLLLGRELPF